jgi:hypothetical protein
VVLSDPDFPDWQLAAMRRWDVDYVLVDRREESWSNTTGYFFARPSEHPPSAGDDFPEWQYDKFAALGADRLLDGGYVALYDVDGIVH